MYRYAVFENGANRKRRKTCLESHVRSVQHQRCDQAVSSSVGNVLAPQSRMAVPVLAVAILSRSTSLGDSSCQNGNVL